MTVETLAQFQQKLSTASNPKSKLGSAARSSMPSLSEVVHDPKNNSALTTAVIRNISQGAGLQLHLQVKVGAVGLCHQNEPRARDI